MQTTPESTKEPLRWLREKHDLASLTLPDAFALVAIAACWQLYFRRDRSRQEHVLFAIGRLLRCTQPQLWNFAKDLIVWADETADQEKIWQHLVEGDPQLVRDFFDAGAGS